MINPGPCYISSTKFPGASAGMRGGGSNIIVLSEDLKNEFSVQLADEGKYRINLYNEDLVWTLNSIGVEQIHLNIFHGLATQIFDLEPTDNKDTYYLSVETRDGKAYIGTAPSTNPMFPLVHVLEGFAEREKSRADKFRFDWLD